MFEQIIPYRQFLRVENLGFNEECFGVYFTRDGDVRLKLESELGNAPTYDQVFKWFRDKHNYSGEVYFYMDTEFNKWHFDIEPLTLGGERYTTPMKESFETYEEARIACIEKLIEIVENEK